MYMYIVPHCFISTICIGADQQSVESHLSLLAVISKECILLVWRPFIRFISHLLNMIHLQLSSPLGARPRLTFLYRSLKSTQDFARNTSCLLVLVLCWDAHHSRSVLCMSWSLALSLQVLHDGVYSLDLSECALGPAELGLVWRLCPRLKMLDVGLRRGCRDLITSDGRWVWLIIRICTCVTYTGCQYL